MNKQALAPGVINDVEDRKVRSYDFGGMSTKMPEAVVIPKSIEEVSDIVRSAAANGVQLTIRGGGHSQGGQSITDRGLVLDTMNLDRVELLGPDMVRAQGGAHWGTIIDTLQGTDRLPCVLVDVAEVTVGGTLSAGGLGTTSHRHGLQVGQVEQLEVVTGTGERMRCSRKENPDLFDAVRGGQGQFGVITDAWIRLRRAGQRIRQFELRYRDYDRFANDFERIIDDSRFDRLRAETRVHDHEIIMGAGVEYDSELDSAKVLDGLGYDEVVNTRDTARVGRAGMYYTWLFSRRNYYPWRDWFMPWGTLRTVLDQPWLDRDWVPRSPASWIGVYPINAKAVNAPLCIHPQGERMFSYSILSVLGRYEAAIDLAAKLKEITGALIDLGGKSYLSGDVGYGRMEWEQHYGDMLEKGNGWKKSFDPNQVFQGDGMPFR